MPRPALGAQLIHLEAGWPDFRRGDWWSTYKEARLFVARGFAETMTTLDLHTVQPLSPFTKPAADDIAANTRWPISLPVQRHWEDCSRAQLSAAAESKPMLLCKAVIAMEALGRYAAKEGYAVDVYANVKIVPLAYRPDGWGLKDYEDHSSRASAEYKRFVEEARRLGQVRPDLILHDMAKGFHATYELARLVRDIFGGNITVISANRPGQRGVAPASDHIVLP